jgi:polysaccharide biosynthesis transport protein
MEDIYQEQKSEGLDIQLILSIVRRRHLFFLVPLFLGWLMVWGASWVLPPRYKSSTLILVTQPTMPQNYVVPNINDDLQERLQSITQQIESRTRLLVIIDKLHLYQHLRKGVTTPDDQVNRMRRDIDIEPVRDPDKDVITSFGVSYWAADPRTAQQVTSELTDLFISENSKERLAESEDTTKFIESQLASARASLADQEAKVRQFEGQHEGDLPMQQTSNLQILSGLQSQLQNQEDALSAARQQHAYLQALLEEYHSAHPSTRSSDGTSADGLGAPTDLQSIDEQLDKLRARLTDLSSRYTDRYPDVQSVKTQIAKLEATRAGIVAASAQKSKDSTTSAAGADGMDSADAASSAPLMQLQGQLQANQVETANRERAISELNARINGYQERLNAEPATEQQLADLTRGYEQSKANYDELLKKRDESEMATSMEHMQQGERFTMIDPPSLPIKPDFPNRLKFCGMGLGFGFALGIVVVGAFELMDDRMHSEKEIKALLPVAVISEVPRVENAKEELKEKQRLVFGWVTAVVVAVIILGGTVVSYLHA